MVINNDNIIAIKIDEFFSPVITSAANQVSATPRQTFLASHKKLIEVVWCRQQQVSTIC